MIRAALAAALLAAAASAPAADPAATAKPAAKPADKKQASPGKPRAPVRVTGRLVQGSAHVELKFDSAARDVSVRLHGTNGLTVADAEPRLAKTDFAAGEVLALEVSFTAPAGQANVVVSVDGEFHGVRQGTVASFRVGKLSPEQQKEQERGVVSDGKGGTIKIGPAQEH